MPADLRPHCAQSLSPRPDEAEVCHDDVELARLIGVQIIARPDSDVHRVII